jgi:hypothetical protein
MVSRDDLNDRLPLAQRLRKRDNADSRVQTVALRYSRELVSIEFTMLGTVSTANQADITSNFNTVPDDIPKYLLARVKTEFRLRKRKWALIRNLRPSQARRRSHIRHISLRLEARVKRADPEDYFALPGANKQGGLITFDVEFQEGEIGRSLHGTTRTATEAEDRTEADFNFEGSHRRPGTRRLSYWPSFH